MLPSDFVQITSPPPPNLDNFYNFILTMIIMVGRVIMVQMVILVTNVIMIKCSSWWPLISWLGLSLVVAIMVIRIFIIIVISVDRKTRTARNDRSYI